MPKVLIRPIAYAVYREEENPILGELVTHVITEGKTRHAARAH